MKRLTGVVAVLAVLAGAALAEAGRVPGPGRDVATVQAFGKVTYYDTFRGGDLAVIYLDGDGATDLDIYVYDENNNLVAWGTGPSDIETVSFRPRWTGRFRIEIRNLGSTWNRYVMRTN
jgi:hypothetical protein